MSAFTVTVCRLDRHPIYFFAIGTSAAAVGEAAADRFGVCGVSVKPI